LSFLLALVLSQLTVVSPVTSVPTIPPPTSLDSTEMCVGSGGRINMDRVMILENRTLVVDGGTGPLRLRLEGETFYSDEVGEHSRHRTYSNWIGTFVQPGAELDIDLKLALLNGRLLLYWRETYQHRFWRFGLITIEGRALFGEDAIAMRPLCEGMGGSQSTG
jgi:hypothetical protein